MTMIDWDKFPHLAKDENARRWLQFTANIGRAPNTVLAYGRAVEDHLRFCGKVGVEPLTARADVVAAWIGDMHQRPNPRSAKLVHLDSGSGAVERHDPAAGRGGAVVPRVPGRGHAA